MNLIKVSFHEKQTYTLFCAIFPAKHLLFYSLKHPDGPASVVPSYAGPTGDQEVTCSIPARAEVLVSTLTGLSLPSKSVVR